MTNSPIEGFPRSLVTVSPRLVHAESAAFSGSIVIQPPPPPPPNYYPQFLTNHMREYIGGQRTTAQRHRSANGKAPSSAQPHQKRRTHQNQQFAGNDGIVLEPISPTEWRQINRKPIVLADMKRGGRTGTAAARQHTNSNANDAANDSGYSDALAASRRLDKDLMEREIDLARQLMEQRSAAMLTQSACVNSSVAPVEPQKHARNGRGKATRQEETEQQQQQREQREQQEYYKIYASRAELTAKENQVYTRLLKHQQIWNDAGESTAPTTPTLSKRAVSTSATASKHSVKSRSASAKHEQLRRQHWEQHKQRQLGEKALNGTVDLLFLKRASRRVADSHSSAKTEEHQLEEAVANQNRVEAERHHHSPHSHNNRESTGESSANFPIHPCLSNHILNCVTIDEILHYTRNRMFPKRTSKDQYHQAHKHRASSSDTNSNSSSVGESDDEFQLDVRRKSENRGSNNCEIADTINGDEPAESEEREEKEIAGINESESQQQQQLPSETQIEQAEEHEEEGADEDAKSYLFSDSLSRSSSSLRRANEDARKEREISAKLHSRRENLLRQQMEVYREWKSNMVEHQRVQRQTPIASIGRSTSCRLKSVNSSSPTSTIGNQQQQQQQHRQQTRIPIKNIDKTTRKKSRNSASAVYPANNQCAVEHDKLPYYVMSANPRERLSMFRAIVREKELSILQQKLRESERGGAAGNSKMLQEFYESLDKENPMWLNLEEMEKNQLQIQAENMADGEQALSNLNNVQADHPKTPHKCTHQHKHHHQKSKFLPKNRQRQLDHNEKINQLGRSHVLEKELDSSNGSSAEDLEVYNLNDGRSITPVEWIDDVSLCSSNNAE